MWQEKATTHNRTVLVFFHLEKTGGTSVADHLARSVGPSLFLPCASTASSMSSYRDNSH